MIRFRSVLGVNCIFYFKLHLQSFYFVFLVVLKRSVWTRESLHQNVQKFHFSENSANSFWYGFLNGNQWPPKRSVVTISQFLLGDQSCVHFGVVIMEYKPSSLDQFYTFNIYHIHIMTGEIRSNYLNKLQS